MKKVTFTMVLVVLLTWAVQAQNPSNLFWSMTVHVKMDKRLEWEKKFATYVKTHYPAVKYRVYEVITGDNTGAYVVVMGPMSYKDMDAFPVSVKGVALERSDAQALDALCNSVTVSHFRRVDELSTANAQRKLKFLVVTMNEIKLGTWGEVSEFLKRRKEAREKGGSTSDIDYFRPSNSGAGNVYAYIQYVEKLEDLETDHFDMNSAYDKLFGTNAWYRDWANYISKVEENQTEIRVLRPDLSVM